MTASQVLGAEQIVGQHDFENPGFALARACIYELILTRVPLARAWQNAVALFGAGGLGMSLFLIHIYVAPMKRFLQLLWATGVVGGLSIMASQVQAGFCSV
jgi:uncharacterized integral membrane protein